jgi:hypothetical protein
MNKLLPSFHSAARRFALVLVAAIVVAAPAFAAPYAVGQKVDSFQARDAAGTLFTFDPSAARFLLISHDMDTGKKANPALDALGAGYLPGKKAVYVANIHGMPAIGRKFALPKMKKYAHRIILGDDATLMARFPGQAGKVTVLALSGGKVTAIRYWKPGQPLDAVLK